ncbi:MAG: WG repeat-containing protein [Mucilaginibacter sp.]
MKKTLIALLIVFVTTHLFAQKKIAGVYNSKYKEFIPSDTGTLVKEFKEGLAPFMIKGAGPFDLKNDHVGFIDTTGRIIIKPVYNNASNFDNGRALVEFWRTDNVGREYHYVKLIDKKGHVIIHGNNTGIIECVNKLYVRFSNAKMSIVNKDGHVIVPSGKYRSYATPPPQVYEESTDDVGRPEFRWYQLWNYPLVQFKNYIGVKALNNKWAAIDSTGKEIFPAKFDGMGIFEGVVVSIRIGKKFGIADTAGNIVVQPEYDLLEFTKNNNAIVKANNRYGLISLSGKVIIPLKYEFPDQIKKEVIKVENQ